MRTRTLLAALLFSVSAAWCQTQTQVDYQTQVKNKNYSGPSGLSRTIQSKLTDEMSVKDFGAIGDGQADDTAELQAALNAVCSGLGQAHKGGRLYFNVGTYNISATIGPSSACEGVDIYGNDSEISNIGTHISWHGPANGVVFQAYGLSWSKIHNLHIDGNGTAGVGFYVWADTVAPVVVRSNQRNEFDHIYVRDITGTPGYCLQVGRLNHGDDVSQAYYTGFTLTNCHVGLFQGGDQTLANIYEGNTLAGTDTYGMQFMEGDINVDNNWFIGGSSQTQLANIYIDPGSLWARIQNNYYEDLSQDPTHFANYLFPVGANPNRPFHTTILGDRVLWNLTGGKILDYEQAGPIELIGQNTDGINGSAAPGTYYVTSGTGCCTVFADFVGGWSQVPAMTISLGNNVVAHSDTVMFQMMTNVFEGRDASITSGSATLTIGTGAFTSTMVGYVCYVQNYIAGSTFGQQNAVTAFIDSTHVTLATPSTNTASNLYYRCGHVANGGQASTIVSDTINEASSVIEGQTPQFQLRRMFPGSSPRNYAWRADSAGSHFSMMSGDSPIGSTYSDFMQMVPNGTTPSSVTFPVPIRFGGPGNPAVGFFFQDYTNQTGGTIPSLGILSYTLTVTGGQSVTPADSCTAFGGNATAGMMTSCLIASTNTVQVTYFNASGADKALATPFTIRVAYFKTSYTGP